MDTSALKTALSGVDFSVVLDGVIELVPIVIVPVLGFIAFKKGFAFVKKQIKGA
jgi:hypothetical protein